uniref:PXA domain-containing protein n=1 Tax=Hydatigena taeniaeformis TaxID=6205 RepID=A0A0R3WVH7_HYDTA
LNQVSRQILSRSLDLQILEYIIDDYVRYWYAHLTSETEFPDQLHAAIAQLASKVAKRAQRIDWVPFMIEGIPNMVIEHLRIHRRSLERRPLANTEEQIKLFFDEEVEMEKQICREAICTSKTRERNHLRKVTDVFLFAIMPEEDYRIVTVRYLIKVLRFRPTRLSTLQEILVNGVLLPAVNILADSDFVNQSIIKLCNESAFASPYFIQSLRMSTREDELQAVKERIEIFSAKLRGHDSGGDDVSTEQFEVVLLR